MNQRKLKRVVALYRAKVSKEVCISCIIEMSKTNLEAAIFICKFIEAMKMIEEVDKNESLD